MALTTKQRSYLRGLAHGRKPVVITGNAGVSAAVIQEIEQCLTHHELIKIKLNAGDRHERQQLTDKICRETGSEWVQNIGRVAVVYRPAQTPIISLPK